MLDPELVGKIRVRKFQENHDAIDSNPKCFVTSKFMLSRPGSLCRAQSLSESHLKLSPVNFTSANASAGILSNRDENGSFFFYEEYELVAL